MEAHVSASPSRRRVILALPEALRCFVLAGLLVVPAYAQQYASRAEHLEARPLATNRLEHNLEKLNRVVSYATTEAPAEQALQEIAALADLKLVYGRDRLAGTGAVTLDLRNVTALEALNEVLRGTALRLQLAPSGQLIVVQRADGRAAEADAAEVLDHQVAGNVATEAGDPLPGVNVVVKGTTIGTISSTEGAFSLTAPNPDDTLVFSFVGFVPQEVPIAGRSLIDVVLEEDVSALNEVVVLGYGSQVKRDLTGAISSVSAEDLSRVPASQSFTQALQGQAAGVQVVSSSGETGAPTRVMIRGTSSISAETEPLYIIDGMPVTNNTRGVALSRGNVTNQDPLAAINPEDIQSIEVLKDAAATSIYGSRGSNGVIIVTTKSGQFAPRGQTTISVRRGVTDLSRQPEDVGFANADQWLTIVNQARENSGESLIDLDFINEQRLGREYDVPINQIYDTNWFDAALQRGSLTDVNLSTSRSFGGEAGANFFASVNYRTDEGVRPGDTFDRFSGRFNFDFQPSARLTVSTRLTGSFTDNARAPNGGAPGGNDQIGNGGFRYVASSVLPIFPIEQDGVLWNPTSGYNVVASSDRDNLINDARQYRAIGGLFVQYDVPGLTGLTLRTEGSLDVLNTNDVQWASARMRPAPAAYAFSQTFTFRNFNYNLYGTYNTAFGAAHRLTLTAGTEAQQRRSHGAYVEGVGLSGSAKQAGSPIEAPRVGAFNLGEERYLLAFFSRASYVFRDRYIVGFSLRRDGASIFTPENRWGTFAALSGGWILSDERFFQRALPDAISFLKLRASYGETGNQSVPENVTVDSYQDWGRYAGNNPGDMQTNIGNPGVTWETTEAFDVGVEFEIAQGRVSGEAGFYRQDATDLLLQTPVPPSTGNWAGGFNYWNNIGDLRNQGLEFTLTAFPILTDRFSWRTSANFTTNGTEVLQLTPELDDDGRGLGFGPTITITGGPLGAYNIPAYAGIDPVGGYELIYAVDNARFLDDGVTENPNFGELLLDENGDRVTIPATRNNLRSNRLYREDQTGLPRWFGGFTNAFSYGGFELTTFLTFQGGNYIYDTYERMRVTPGFSVLSPDLIGNTWTPENPDAEYPLLRWNQRFDIVDAEGNVVQANERFDARGNQDSDRYLHRGDFLRLRTLQLSYTWTRPGYGNQRITAYLSGNNLFTITGYDGWEPEVVNLEGNARGRNLNQGTVGGAILPQLRSFTTGLTVTF